ncbi:glycosyltransferase family 4 protein [Parvimonas micra]
MDSSVWGGMEQYVYDMSEELQRQGVAPFVLTDMGNPDFVNRYGEVATVLPIKLSKNSRYLYANTVAKFIRENNIDTREMGGYTVNSYVPFCCTQNLSGGYSIILQTFLCKVEGKIIPNSNETRNVRWMNVDDIYSSINKNLEVWYPMHINTLFKFIDYYQKGFIYE